MIPLAGVVAALKGAGTPFKFVGGAADLAAANADLKTFPAAYVLPLQDSALGGNQAAHSAVVQQLTERFGVMYAVRNLRATAGEKAQEEMRQAIDWARGKLLGLQIDADRDLVQFEGGELVVFEDEILIWSDRYFTKIDKRKV